MLGLCVCVYVCVCGLDYILVGAFVLSNVPRFTYHTQNTTPSLSCYTAVGIGSWMFHGTLLYEMQVCCVIGIKLDSCTLNSWRCKNNVGLHGGILAWPDASV